MIKTALSALAAASLLAGAALAQAPGQLFYERSLMAAAGARCKLFTPTVAGALAASAQQARGAALRGGADPSALKAVETRARERAAATSCGSADLKLAAERVRSAFAGYARMATMSFPGESAGWQADRGRSNMPVAGWRLSQAARSTSGPVVFGVAGDTGPDALTAVTAWPESLAAAGARLVVRDPAKSPRPYLDPRRKGLAGRVPPRTVATAFLATGKTSAPATLMPAGAALGAAFRFPASAVRALEQLDPREAVVLELVYPTREGERVEQTPIEVGDFAAARAFLAAR